MGNDLAVAVLKKTKAMLNSALEKETEALPNGFNQMRFKQNALTVLQETKGLEKLQGNEFSLTRALMKGAYLGLDFFNKECYCIVYGGSAEFQTDYKGEIKLAKKYSLNPIRDIYAKLVREGDKFEEKIINGQQTINFEPKSFNNGEILGAFAVCYFQDGSMLYEAMSTEDIEYIRKNFSKMPNGPSWTKSKGEMYKKTVLRRLCKLVELDFENIKQRETFVESSDMTFDKNEEQFETSPFDEDVNANEIEGATYEVE